MPVDISINESEWVMLEKMLGSIDAKKVARRATKDVAKTVRTRVARFVSQYFTLKYGDTLRGIKVSGRGETSAKVNLEGRRQSLRSFRGSPKKPRHEMSRTKSGKMRKVVYRYEIEKGRKRTAQGVFVQRTSRAGYEGGSGLDRYADKAIPFKRVGRSRYPVTVPRGPSVPAIWQAKNRNRIAKDVLIDARELLQRRIRGQTFRLLEQQAKSTQRQVGKLGA